MGAGLGGPVIPEIAGVLAAALPIPAIDGHLAFLGLGGDPDGIVTGIDLLSGSRVVDVRLVLIGAARSGE